MSHHCAIEQVPLSISMIPDDTKKRENDPFPAINLSRDGGILIYAFKNERTDSYKLLKEEFKEGFVEGEKQAKKRGDKTMIKIEEIKGRKIWFYIEQLISLNPNEAEDYEQINKFMCYFNNSEPNLVIHGQIIRDDKGQVILFNSEDEALEHGKKYVERLLA